MEAAEAASPPAARPAASAQLQAVGTRGSSASRGKRATGCTNLCREAMCSHVTHESTPLETTSRNHILFELERSENDRTTAPARGRDSRYSTMISDLA